MSEKSLQRIQTIGFQAPSPIQAAFIPIAIRGDDCTGQARTGTGKTAAFVLPILDRIDPNESRTQALVLCPTRELGEQVANECHRLAANHEFRTAVFVGGRPLKPQLNELHKGVDIAIGTPGRVIDLIDRKALDLQAVKIVVLDEADRMLDIGFRPDIEKILRRMSDRSADAAALRDDACAGRTARQAVHARSEAGQSVRRQRRRRHGRPVLHDGRRGPEIRHAGPHSRLRAAAAGGRLHAHEAGAERLYRKFSGKLPGVAMMSGDLPQAKRDQVMTRFRAGKIRLLVATDVVGRGIDVQGISHIFNYDIPEYCDDYVHRVGRTGRLCSSDRGWAITFVTRDQGEQLTGIEKRINTMLPEYRVEDFEAFRPRERRPTVDELAAKRAAVESEPQLDFSVA